MPLPTFKKAEDVPEAFRDEYEEQDGEWKPKELTKLRGALDDEKEKRKAAELLTKKALKEAAEAKADKDAEKAGLTETELKKIRDDAAAAAKAEFADKVAEAERLAAENRTLKLTDKVQALFAAAGFLPERLKDVLHLHEAEFDLTADGKPMVKSEPAKDLAKHIAGIAKQRPEWVRGTQAAGGGANGTQTGGGTTPDEKMTPEDRLARAHEAGKTN